MNNLQNKLLNLVGIKSLTSRTNISLVLELFFSTAISLSLTQSVHAAAVTTPLDLTTIPLSNSPTVPIRSNLLFIFDDSGSMAIDYMPDNSNSSNVLLRRNPAYNTIAYNPSIVYLPPVTFTNAGISLTTYRSQTGAATANGASAATKPNWEAVRRDAYGVLSGASDNITNNANYFLTLPGNATISSEYCTRADLKDCATQVGPTAARQFHAPVRWCSSNAIATSVSPAVNACQATFVTGFTSLRIPSPRVSTITFNGGGTNRIVNGLTIGGSQVMSAATVTNTNNVNTIAAEVATRINDCANVINGNCAIAGYAAIANGGAVTIYAPANSTTTATPTIAQAGGSAGQAITAFARAPHPTIGGVNNAPGQTVYRVILPASPTAPTFSLPGSATKASDRSDCVGATCTYGEEMTNYANWYTYYRTRTQMMKTSTSLAFRDIGENFKVGFMTTSGNNARALNFARFTTANKALWYTRLFSTVADTMTPLRGALSKAGRIYANVPAAKGTTFSDPIEYECQQNFTLLTTDGIWNNGTEGATFGPLNVTGGLVGNTDSLALGTPLGMREGTPPVSNTLADVAKYYKDTDLRTPALNNCTGALGANICQTTSAGTPPPNEKQTMVTLTMGLGVDGLLSYVSGYDKNPGDFADIKAGTKNWPDPIANSGPQRIDDLWHAAVNGGGTYFSAKTPTEVVNQLKEVIALINVKTGSGAAASTSTLTPTSSDNAVFIPTYRSGQWTGNLERRTIDNDAEVSLSATHCVEDILPTESCAAPSQILLNDSGGYDCVTPDISDADDCAGTLDGTDCKVPVSVSCVGSLKSMVGDFTSTARSIKFNQGGTLGDFRYVNLTTSQRQYFDAPWLAANLTQWASLTTAQITNANGTNLVNYLRGEKGYELGSITDNNRVFRKRQATLGDLVESTPVVATKPSFSYADSGYEAFKAAQAGRPSVVYVGSNDGMLHAFNANNLTELWAYVPSMVIPNLWKLADSNYSARHSYYVNGDITIADICSASCNTAAATWKTILVAGLHSGGRGYFALDVTNPNNPVLLWEFDAKNTGLNADQNLGYSFGNPVVTKRSSDGRWVVLFTSGYNNIPDNNTFYGLTTTNFKPNNPALFTGGDGRGYLYVVDANSGTKLNIISTGVGSVANPSGLAKINTFVEQGRVDNTTTYVYVGDLQGNLWRFDISTNQVFNLAKLQAGIPQPITTIPELGLVEGNKVVFLGTGKYLEVSDLGTNDQQSFYAIKDPILATQSTRVNPRGDTTFVRQAIIPGPGPDERSGDTNAPDVNFSIDNGWYLDFPDTRERQNVRSTLFLGTLVIPTTVPESTACQPAGFGWLTFLDFGTGKPVQTNIPTNIVSTKLISPSVGGFFSVNDQGVSRFVNTGADGRTTTKNVPIAGSIGGFQLRRSIWREIAE